MLIEISEGIPLKTLIQMGTLALLVSLESWWPQFQVRRGRLQHDLTNLGFGLGNAMIILLLFSGVMAIVAAQTTASHFGLLNLWPGPAWLRWCGAVVLFDLWMYLWHRANHRIHFLWRFHRMHHTDSTLDASSALRFHPGEIILSSLLRLLVLPLLGMTLAELLLYETLLQPVILLHHSNIRFPEPLDRVLRAVIVTPHMHWLHHSDRVQEHNSNYASIFSWWDRIGRSFRHRKDIEAIDYGLPQFQGPQWQSAVGMIQTPLK